MLWGDSTTLGLPGGGGSGGGGALEGGGPPREVCRGDLLSCCGAVLAQDQSTGLLQTCF